MAESKVYITLVNWNNYNDTVECIASLTKLQDPNFQILIVDNGSSNGSVEVFKDLMTGECKEQEYTDYLKEKIGDVDITVLNEDHTIQFEHKTSRESNPFQHPVLVVNKLQNAGFAGGQNACFKYIMEQGDYSYAWMLNNDTEVVPDSLSTMVTEIESDEKIGMVGSVLIYHGEKEKIQTIGGGKFYPLLSATKLQYKNMHISELDNVTKEEAVEKLDFLMGASVLVRKEVLDEVGLIDEEYFVYVEEMDWMHRMKKEGWKLSVALDSKVFHKDSSSTKDIKEFYYYQLNKNHMIFLKKHYGMFYNVVSVVPAFLNTMRITQKKKNLRYTIKGLYEGFTYKAKKKIVA
ncbi:glycosyltransferase family 2 protein [Flammeovirgaceae bacterium SG7u.111]|nr:glycosyltransferase family 2 protein [Flammeovirgaceae bacterium SG7u.132]WPO34031.1 glycosyltransferase family 2 protein [Flammeovirgaceae bacterium SG7u.111]